MQTEEQRLIDGLFQRLKETETHHATRDIQAEQRIRTYLHEQPNAPYYMAQTVLIQEAAIKQLNSRLSALEEEVTQLRAKASEPKSSGSFLGGLFGGSSSKNSPAERPFEPIPGSQQYGAPTAQSSAPAYTSQPQQQAPAQRGFMAGALQTAAGVAGGVVIADLLTGMFHHNQPEEVINIINEPEEMPPSFSEPENNPGFFDTSSFADSDRDNFRYNDFSEENNNDSFFYNDDDDDDSSFI